MEGEGVSREGGGGEVSTSPELGAAGQLVFNFINECSYNFFEVHLVLHPYGIAQIFFKNWICGRRGRVFFPIISKGLSTN